MIAAIYARKSTEQTGVAEEQKSVPRQVERARQYAARKGWIVDDAAIFTDDGISGAEFANRPGFLRLMNALKPRPPFQVLVMSEESRLGREAIETAYALKQLVQAGVRVFFYLEDRERTLDGPTDKIMMSLTAFADELERVKGRQRTYDAMERKAHAGHVCGGRAFGFDNVCSACGRVIQPGTTRCCREGTPSDASTRPRRPSCVASSSCGQRASARRGSRSASTRNAPPHRGRRKTGRARGRRRRCGKFCSARPTAAAWRGTGHANAINGGSVTRRHARQASGRRSRRRSSGS